MWGRQMSYRLYYSPELLMLFFILPINTLIAFRRNIIITKLIELKNQKVLMSLLEGY
jgi:hypothetical protein